MSKNETNEKQATTDVEKQDQNDNEPLEVVKEKPPPRINASLIILYAIYFSMFTVGWVNLNRCPINILIPIYLIVGGFLGALTKFLSKTTNKHVFHLVILLIGLNCIWNGLGTYWVFKEYQPNYEPENGKYCDRTTYLMAFWILTFQYTLLVFFILLSLCYLMMRGDFKKI